MAHPNRRPRTPETCPVCGEDVPIRALACPECGADHRSGWKAGALDADGLPDESDDFDYEDFVQREFGGRAGTSSRLHPAWIVTAALLLAALAATALLGVW